MEEIKQSSTFPTLQSVAIQKQNGEVSVSLDQKPAKRKVFSAKCVTVLCLALIFLAITNILTYFLTMRAYKTINSANENASVKNCEYFQIAYEHEGKIKQCLVRHPTTNTSAQILKHPISNNASSIQNKRIGLNFSEVWCKLALKHALPEDEGPWELSVELNDNKSNQNYQLYNVSVQKDLIFVPQIQSNKTNHEPMKIYSTVKTYTDFSPNVSLSNFYTNINRSLTRSFKKTTAYQICPRNWTMLGNHCYKSFRRSIYVTRNEASNSCIKEQSNLASIDSKEEQNLIIAIFVKSKTPPKKVWVGGKRIQNQWKWDDGSSFEYTNWSGNEPDSEENCMYLHYDKNYAWKDANCGIDGKRWAISTFLCQKSRI